MTSNVKRMNVKTIHEYLSKQSYWAENIPLKVVERFMQHSFCFAVLQKTEQLVLQDWLPIILRLLI